MLTLHRCAAFAALSPALLGCSVLGRISAVPNVDTRGGVGVEVKLTMGVGVTTAFDHERRDREGRIGLVAFPASAGGGVRVRGEPRGELGFDAGLEYASVGRRTTDFGFQTGLGFASRFQERAGPLFGATLAGGIFWTLARRREPGLFEGARATLGPAMEATALGGERERGLVRFGLGVALAGYGLTEWTVR